MASSDTLLAVPVNGSVETCLTVFPKFDLGNEEVEYFGVMHLVYATIDSNGVQTCRVAAFSRTPFARLQTP